MFRYASTYHVKPVFNKRWTSTFVPRPLDRLKEINIVQFQTRYFKPGLPVLLSKGQLSHLPAITQWFAFDQSEPKLNSQYLNSFAETTVPIELFKPAQGGSPAAFQRTSVNLGLCIEMMESTQALKSTRVYIAQCPLADLPHELQADVPVPELVKLAGKGDVYDSSIWIGPAPTFTPLHKDPNPNLFVQLCGSKVVRLLKPSEGEAVMQHVRRTTLQTGTSSAMRGEEMMAGSERDLLEKLIWDPRDENLELFECSLSAGEGLFIPKGWWHSLKGIGEGMNGSVSKSRPYSEEHV